MRLQAPSLKSQPEGGPFFRKTVADSNAPVQEKALDALMLREPCCWEILPASSNDAPQFCVIF
ncbi:ARM repeat superfamily protein [Actinidia rufa]|uniref:ARM repeat superfamily protein n=1 Tax=Actinidia rufa TaxID=165716 RepID=A0A7J0DK44_9ERIC|nr:ARM repeat superfamily protein [Actinidia rufa]